MEKRMLKDIFMDTKRGIPYMDPKIHNIFSKYIEVAIRRICEGCNLTQYFHNSLAEEVEVHYDRANTVTYKFTLLNFSLISIPLGYDYSEDDKFATNVSQDDIAKCSEELTKELNVYFADLLDKENIDYHTIEVEYQPLKNDKEEVDCGIFYLILQGEGLY